MNAKVKPRMSQRLQGRAARIVASAALAALLAACALGPGAQAAPAAPPELWSACNVKALEAEDGSPIPPAPEGQSCSIPRGIAAYPPNGRLFVADQSNQRVVELNARGEFIKTWGWDVVASGPGDTPEDEFEICVPEDGDTCKAGLTGGGAGQLDNPKGLDLDSASGVYVGGNLNARVSKFDSTGQFEFAFGRDVVAFGPSDSANKETQEVKVAQSSGTFTLGFSNPFPEGGNAQTAPLPFNASAAEVQAALNALPTISGPGGSVLVAGGPGDPTGSAPYEVTFEGNLAGDDVPQLTVAQAVGAQLSCSTPTVAETISYQWLRNGAEISGATFPLYTATAADEGDAIQCRVTAANPNAGSIQTSEPAQVIAGSPRTQPPTHPGPIPAPEASSPLAVGGPGGQTLSCDADEAGWKYFDFVWGYRWFRNGLQVASSGFTGGNVPSTYEVAAADLASPAVFQCEITVRARGGDGFQAAKASEALHTEPPPSSPPAPEAEAETSPASATATLADGGGPEVCRPADSCKAGTEGTAPGEFGKLAPADFIATDTKGTVTDADDRVYVGDVKRIQVFDSGGNYLEDVPLDPEGELKDRTVTGLAVDAAGMLYLTYSGRPDVRKLDPLTGKELASPRFEIPPPAPFITPVATAVAVGDNGHVYVFDTPTGSGSNAHTGILEFDSTGKVVDQFGKGEFNFSTGLATNLCPGSEAPGNLYVANSNFENGFVRAYGTEPDGCFKAKTLPAEPIGELTATLNGTVNPKGEAVEECFFEWGETAAYGETAPCDLSPGEIGEGSEPVAVKADLAGLTRATVYHFRLIAVAGGEAESGADLAFKTAGPPVISEEHVESATDTEATLRGLANPEGLATTCHFDYTTQAAFEEGGFAAAQSTADREVGEDRTDHTLSANLAGLAPATAYRWRLLCTNSSDTVTSPALPLATYSAPASTPPGCPNEALRTGLAALLPDCRAYEMVSPVDKNGGDILLHNEGNVQARPDGERLAYSTIPSFGDAENAWVLNQYLASRGAQGWSNHGIHPPVVGREPFDLFGGFGLFADLNALSTDLCSAWWWDYLDPPTAPGAQVGRLNLQRRENCGPGEGELEALFPEPPPLPQDTPDFYVTAQSVQGVSEDGEQAVFYANNALLPDCRTTTSAPAVSFQWLRNGVPIEGATGPVYTPAPADAGSALQCRVLAANASAADAASLQVSNPAIVFPPAPGVEISPPAAPEEIAAPATSATLTVGGPGGQTLTCDPNAAEWEGSPAFSYAWYRNGTAIEAAAASTYQVTEADLATRAVFQCAVTGTNADGAVGALSFHRATSPGPVPAAPGGNGATASAVAVTDRGVARLYDRFEGELRPVSVLPGGRFGGADAVVGSGWTRNLGNAVSADGSRVYWVTGLEASPKTGGVGIGTIYLRLHPEQGIIADECVSPAVACTVPVSGPNGFFWIAARDGSRALYSEGSLEDATAELFEFDLNEGGEPQTRSVAKGLEGVVGASEDLSRIYFVSREALAGEAKAGEPNLYLDEEGAVTFIATLLEGDVGAAEPGAGTIPYDLASRIQARRAIRVSPDGSTLLFQSRAPLTGYDNTDRANGKADVEVFRYEAGKDELACISCNPSGARPVGRELRLRHWNPTSGGGDVFAAAWIPGREQPLHASAPLSSDGERVFFNSNDALLPRDTNGTMDVYQWEAPGKGSCTTEDPNYFPQNGGCLYLISSGGSPFESEFWEADADGSDVFFTTESSLVGSDPGLVDLYDARIEGGFPEASAPAACEGEACQSPPSPPDDPTPASSAFRGAGNVVEPPPSCGPAARRARRAARQAKRSRRAARRAASPARRRAMSRRAKRTAKQARRLSQRAKRCRRAARRAR